MLDLEDQLLNPEFPAVMIAVIFLAAAVVSTLTGKTISRSRGWVFRAKDPSDFWGCVAIYYVAAIVGIGIYLYGVYKFQN